jgi:anaerobic selenocysteine-containing dehydrogenase
MVVTDSFDQPGGMWFNPGYFTRLDHLDGLPRAAAPEPSPPSRPDIARCGGEWPATLIPDEIAAGRLRALVVLGSNLVTALPQPARVQAALEAIDTLVVLDVVDNGTTDAATHVFACAGQFERADVLPLELNANAVYQHYTDAVVTPRADRPPMWQTLGRIAAGLGLDALGGGVDPIDTTTEAMLTRMSRGDALARLRDAGGIAIESGPVYDWVRSRIPAGRWNLAPAVLLEQLDLLAAPVARPQLAMTPRRVMPRMNWQEYRAVAPGLLMHPDDAATVGVADGDDVIVDAHAGSIRVRAELTPNITRGAVSVVHGVEAANVNELMDASDLDGLTGMARLAAVPVTVRPA